MNKHLTKENIHMESKHIKRCKLNMLPMNCKLKQRWYTTTHLVEWPKSRTLTTPNADKDVEQQNSNSLLTRIQNGTDTLENSVAVSYKIKLNIWYSSCASWYSPKGVENLCPHKNPNMDVYSWFNHNCENQETTKIFLSRWMNK